VVTTVEVKGKQRPESFVGRDGTRYVASYDGNGRTYALTLPDKRLMVVLQRDDAGVLTDASLINLDTGITLIAASPREWRRKHGAGHKIITANGDVDYVEVITVVGTADDPFSSEIFGNDPEGAGQSLGMQQTFQDLQPPNCSLADCGHVCDEAYILSLTACAALGFNVPAAVLCVAVAEAVHISCANACQQCVAA
jgi:hypothetical protein